MKWKGAEFEELFQRAGIEIYAWCDQPNGGFSTPTASWRKFPNEIIVPCLSQWKLQIHARRPLINEARTTRRGIRWIVFGPCLESWITVLGLPLCHPHLLYEWNTAWYRSTTIWTSPNSADTSELGRGLYSAIDRAAPSLSYIRCKFPSGNLTEIL